VKLACLTLAALLLVGCTHGASDRQSSRPTSYLLAPRTVIAADHRSGRSSACRAGQRSGCGSRSRRRPCRSPSSTSKSPTSARIRAAFRDIPASVCSAMVSTPLHRVATGTPFTGRSTNAVTEVRAPSSCLPRTMPASASGPPPPSKAAATHSPHAPRGHSARHLPCDRSSDQPAGDPASGQARPGGHHGRHPGVRTLTTNPDPPRRLRLGRAAPSG
jgi:hypothetical protein